jgi:hypothetical protein
MANSGAGAPLSRRQPGAARQGPGQSAKPVLSESVLNRMKAAIDAEHAQDGQGHQDDPNTEPMPRVTDSGSPSRRSASRAPSPSGVGPETEPLPDRAAKPDRGAKPPRPAEPPRPDEPLRVAKALRVVEPDWPRPADPAPPPPAELAPQALPAPRMKVAPPVEPAAPAEPAPPVELVPPLEQAAAAQPAPPSEPLRLAEPPAAAAPPAPAPAAVPAPRVPAWSPPVSTSQTEPTPGSIGWLWPDEGGTGRGGGRWKPPRPWRYRTVGLVAAGAIVLGGAGVAIGMVLHHSTPAPGGGAGTATGPNASGQPTVSPSNPGSSNLPPVPLPPTSTAAASWITQQVTTGTFVACDAQMCAALTTAGFPAAQEVQVGMSSQSLSNAQLVVLTPQLRRYFRVVNRRLGRDVAPPALASFGGISVHPIDQNGSAAYEGQLSQDLQARILAGEQLRKSSRVTESPSAATALSTGQVDSRVLLALQALAAREPIDILAFDDSGPGASSGVPFREVDLALTVPAARMAPQEYIGTLRPILQAHSNFPPFKRVGPTTMPDGQHAAQIEYGVPGSLGLLTP